MNFNIDRVLATIVNLAVKLSKYSRFRVWQPGEKLKILLIGYNGKQNTGADVRVQAMINQFYNILGQDSVKIGVITLNRRKSELYFQTPTEQIQISTIFFWSLLKACSSYHIAVLSEGGCLKSKFSNSLLLYFIEGAGVMKRQGKPCIAYGVEAGEMDQFVYRIAQKHCNKTYFVARTQPSLDIIRDMGIKGELGTDTAWIFQPAPKEWAEIELRKKIGWNGKRAVIGLAIINPFCWPVKPNIGKWIRGQWKGSSQYHYEKWYFLSDSKKRRKLLNNYLLSIAGAADQFAKRHNAQIVIFGMEALDYDPCVRLQNILNTPAYIFTSKSYNGYEMASVLRRLSMLVTSRYHARVLSMPAGTPSIAISIDERLRNLLAENGHLEDYYLEADDCHLREKLTISMEKMWANRKKVSKENLATIPGYLELMGNMGATFRNFIKKNFPLFPLPPEPKDWKGYLPPLCPELSEVINRCQVGRYTLRQGAALLETWNKSLCVDKK